MLTFNQFGLLTPAEVIRSSMEDFEEEFAINLNSEARRELMKQYKAYCEGLKKLCGAVSITQWIDGSFVTINREPKDIDLVFFLDYKTAKSREKELKEFLYPASVRTYGIDGYMVVVYPEGHKDEFKTKSDRLYWLEYFGMSKPTRRRKPSPKGFLEIII